ncbi:MAG: PilC/PilY family type IV pilus protein, partial [Burkholderiaceae bacterium]
MNWRLYYFNKIEASKTAIGKAFLSPAYDNKLRLGYKKMNANGGPADRGVRPFTDDPTLAAGRRTERSDFYTWLYGQVTGGSTPANRLLDDAGDYYIDNSSTGPWAAQPVHGGDNSPHLSCRRSTAVLFSDGEYTDSLIDKDNVDGGNFGKVSNTTHVNPLNSVTFVYSKNPSKTASYVAYPDNANDTMADLAASYWITDMRTDLADNVTPVDGNPAFWQHMTTYTIGMGVQGSISPAQIAQYNLNFTRGVTTTLAWNDPTQSVVTNKINDFIHAGYTGRGRFYSANSAKQVQAAFDDVASRSVQQAGADAGVAVSDTNNGLGTLAGELKYVPSYSLLESTGDIKGFTLLANGNEATPNAPAWYASRNIPDHTTRTLVTFSGSGGTGIGSNFVKPYSTLPADVRTALDAAPSVNGFGNDSYVDYLRGNTTGVNAVTSANYRIRNSLMGSVVNSPPTFVRGVLEMGYTTTLVAGTFTGLEKYTPYKKAKTENNLGVLLAAANDGILHVINPKNGTEILGYLPRAAMPKLQAFSTDPYTHQYILDGPTSEGDVYKASPGEWKHIVMGTGGRGGQYVYALNIPTAPASGTLTTPVMSQSDVLWEISNQDTNFSNLGYVLNPPQTGRLPDGRWVAIFGNGYYSATGKASLFIVDALTGVFIQEIVTSPGSPGSPNGLGGVTLVRKDKNLEGSREIVAAIAGDSLGNMWKFDLRTAGAASPGGKVAFGGSPLFTTPGNKAISAAPAWRQYEVKPNEYGMLVVAATGVLNTAADGTDTSVQTIYGVLDKT